MATWPMSEENRLIIVIFPYKSCSVVKPDVLLVLIGVVDITVQLL